MVVAEAAMATNMAREISVADVAAAEAVADINAIRTMEDMVATTTMEVIMAEEEAEEIMAAITTTLQIKTSAIRGNWFGDNNKKTKTFLLILSYFNFFFHSVFMCLCIERGILYILRSGN